MRKCFALMTVLCAGFLAVACQSTSLTEPCDVLVRIDPKPASNSYLVAHDKQAAIAIAQHRGRYQNYNCGQ